MKNKVLFWVGAVLAVGGVGLVTRGDWEGVFALLVGLVLAYFGLRGFDDIKAKFKKAEPAQYHEEKFQVAGVAYHLRDIQKLAVSNPDWKKQNRFLAKHGETPRKVFRYNYINNPVKLIPEPQNPHDPDAVQVIIAGELVGYISRDDNVHVKEILFSHDVKFISAFIFGGQYKVIFSNGEAQHDEDDISAVVKIGYI